MMVDGMVGPSCSVLLSEEYWRRNPGADEESSCIPPPLGSLTRALMMRLKRHFEHETPYESTVLDRLIYNTSIVRDDLQSQERKHSALPYGSSRRKWSQI
jgi:hypothetical protein